MMIGSLTFLGAATGVVEILTDHEIDTSDERLTLPSFVQAFTSLFAAPSISIKCTAR
jgi:hypothetical protein